MDTNKEKDCGIVLLDNELDEITGGIDEAKPQFALKKYGGPMGPWPRPSEPDILVPVRPGYKLDDIKKLLEDWEQKWEKRKADKDKANQ